MLPSNGKILFKTPTGLLSNSTWTDGLAAENAQMQVKHWVSIFIPIAGIIIATISYFTFHRMNKGKTALRLTQ